MDLIKLWLRSSKNALKQKKNATYGKLENYMQVLQKKLLENNYTFIFLAIY